MPCHVFYSIRWSKRRWAVWGLSYEDWTDFDKIFGVNSLKRESRPIDWYHFQPTSLVNTFKWWLVYWDQGVSKRCRLLGWPRTPSYMSPNVGRGGCGGDLANKYSCAHGIQINFGDLTPYLTLYPWRLGQGKNFRTREEWLRSGPYLLNFEKNM